MSKQTEALKLALRQSVKKFWLLPAVKHLIVSTKKEVHTLMNSPMPSAQEEK